MGFRKHINLAVHSAKIELIDRMQDKIAFSFISLGVLVRIAITIILFQALYGQTDAIGGWSLNQTYVLLGTWFLIQTVAWSSYMRGYNRIKRMIELGGLDRMIMRPMNLKYYLAYHTIDVLFSLPEIVTAIALIVYGVIKSDINFNIIYYIFVLCVGIVIHYSITLMVSSINFFFINHQGIFLMDEIFKLGRYPRTIYRGSVKFILSFIVPVTIIFSFPAQAMFGNLSIWELSSMILVAVIFFMGSGLFFNIGLKRYESAQG